MKKLVSMLLVLVLVFSLSVNALAVDITDEVLTEVDENLYQATEFNDVKVSESGEYVIEHTINGETVYEPVAKLELSVSEPTAIRAAIGDTRLPVEVRNEIALQYKQALENGNENFEMTLFSASLASAQGMEEGYAVYNGATMKTERLTSTGLDTGAVKVDSGSKTKETAANFANIFVAVAGTVKEIACTARGSVFFKRS